MRCTPGELFVIEANPRASRTVPFVSKAVGVPLAKLACRIMLGERIADLALPAGREGLGYGEHVSVKEAVLPFDRFEGSDAVLGPEMRSTGEVMGIARDFPTAFAKAQAAAGVPLPLQGTAFITVTDSDKAGAFAVAQILHDNGFRIVATRGTAEAIARMGVPVERLNKLGEGSPHVLDWIERGDVDLVVNTPTGVGARTDGWEIRRAAVMHGIPCLTTLSAGVKRGARDRKRPPRRGAGGAVPAGAARGREPRVRRRDRPLAATARLLTVDRPFGRRRWVAGIDELGVSASCGSPDARRPGPPSPASSRCWRRWSAGAGGRMSGPTWRAPSRSPAGATERLTICWRTWGPGPGACASWRRASRCGRSARLGRASRCRGTAVGRCWWEAAWGSRRWRSGRTSWRIGALCSCGFRDSPRARGAALLRGARIATDDGSAGRHGLVTDLLAEELERDPHAIVYTCGPAPMLEAVRAICETSAVPAQLALEAGMACGFGACYGCVVPKRGGGYLRVCIDGPVIDAAELEYVEEHAGAPA